MNKILVFLKSANFKKWYALIGGLVGLSVFLSFAIVFHNFLVAIFGLLSGIYAAFLFVDIWKRHYINPQTKRLFPVSDTKVNYLMQLIFSGFGVTFGIAGMMFYLIIAGINKEAPIATSDWVVAVWCFMTFKWALALFIHILRHHASPFRLSSKASSSSTYDIQRNEEVSSFTIDD